MTALKHILVPNPDPGLVSDGTKSTVYLTLKAPDSARAEDALLVRRTINGDRNAFDELIRRYQRQAVAVSYRLLGNMQDALEATQDAFLKAYKSLGSLQKPAAFGGWLMRIVANLSLNFRRGRKVRTQIPLEELRSADDSSPFERAPRGETTAPDGDPAHLIESAEMGRRLVDVMKRLPEKQRVALTMFTIDEFSQKEIGAIMGCSVEAVKWHVFQARKALKLALKDYL